MPQLPDGQVVPGPTLFAPLWGVAKSKDGKPWVAHSLDTELGSLMFFYSIEDAEEQHEMLGVAIAEAKGQHLEVPPQGLILPFGNNGGKQQ